MDKSLNRTELIRRRYNRSIRFFELTEKMMEKGPMSEWRRMIWSMAKGKVLEVGVGTGANIKYYPEGLDITAIDFSDKMLEKARSKALKYKKDVKLFKMDVQSLEFKDETFDTIITTCVFCSVPDPVKGLSELKRVCKADGKILMLEHVRSQKKLIGFLMDFANPLIVKTIGVNINRNTVDNILKSTLSISAEENLMMDIVKYIKCNKQE